MNEPTRHILVVDDELDALEGHLSELSDAGHRLTTFRSTDETLKQFLEGDASVFNARRRELAINQSAIETLDKGRQLSATMTQTVDGNVGSAQEEMAAGTEDVASAIASGKFLLAILAAISLGVAVAIAYFYVARNLMGRLERLVNAMREISGGNLQAEIPRSGNDEVVQMAEALVVFRDGLAEVDAANARAEQERQNAAAEKTRG